MEHSRFHLLRNGLTVGALLVLVPPAHGQVGDPRRLLEVQLPAVLRGRLLSEVTVLQAWRQDAEISRFTAAGRDDWIDRVMGANRCAGHLSQGATLI